MTIGTVTDMKVYEQTFNGGYMERLAQNIDGFNAASGGSIILAKNDLEGDFAYESFFKFVAGMSRRDPTSTAAQTPKKLLMDEKISVKVNHKFDQFAMTEDAFYKAGRSPEEFAMWMGEQMADQTVQYMLNRAISVASAAISGVAGLNLDVSAAGSDTKLTYKNLNKLLQLWGDKQAQVVTWVMAGAGVNELVGDMLGGAQFNDSGVSIYEGGAPTLGKKILAIDAPALTPTGKYVILGLPKSAVLVEESEPARSIFERRGGNENIQIQGQAEGAFNVSVKGFKWDVANGGSNPTDSALNTASNWDQTATDIKNLAGLQLTVAQ